METICECCGAKVVEYCHSLCKGQARALYLFAKAGGKSELKDLKFTHSQRCNFPKLRYWELVYKDDNTWHMTQKGMDFLRGNILLPKKVWTYRGEVERYEGDDTSIQDVTGGWKWAEDYAREAVPHV